MAAIAIPQVTWNVRLNTSVRKFIYQAEHHRIIDKIEEQWERISIIFGKQFMDPIPWYRFGALCRDVRCITEKVYQLDQVSLISSWKAVLEALNDSDSNIPRIGYKSTKRSFPLCLEMLKSGDETLKIHKMEVVRTEDDLGPVFFQSYVTRYNDLMKRVFGKNLGTRILEIWNKSSDTVAVYAENIHGHMLAQTQAIYLTIPLGDGEDGRIALICGLSVTPEASKRGIASQIVPCLVNEIFKDKTHERLNGVTFGVQEGNSPMEQFFPIMMERFKTLIPESVEVQEIQGKSLFMPEQITQQWIPVDVASQRRGSPTLEAIDQGLLDASKAATIACGKSPVTFYTLAGKNFLSAWFHGTSLGQFLQERK